MQLPRETSVVSAGSASFARGRRSSSTYSPWRVRHFESPISSTGTELSGE